MDEARKYIQKNQQKIHRLCHLKLIENNCSINKLRYLWNDHDLQGDLVRIQFILVGKSMCLHW
jgi:hypothetical protein